MEEVGHFFFIQGNKIDYLVVLLSELLEGLANVVLHFIEHEKIVTECLYNSLDLFL